eukprot:gene12122-5613_t
MKTTKEEIEIIQQLIHQFILYEVNNLKPKKDVYEILNSLKNTKNNFEVYDLLECFILESLRNIRTTEKVLQSFGLNIFIDLLSNEDEKIVNLSILSLTSLAFQNPSIALLLIQKKIIPSILLKKENFTSRIFSMFFTSFLIHSNLYNEFKRINLFEKNSNEIYSKDYILVLFNVISMYLMSIYDLSNQNVQVDFQHIIESETHPIIIKYYVMKILKNFHSNNLSFKSLIEEDEGPQPHSEIFFSFKIPLILLEDEINDRYKEIEFEDFAENTQYKLKKISKIVLKTQHNMLIFCLPFSIVLKYQKYLMEKLPLKGEFTIFIYTTFEFTKNLKIFTKVHFGIKWKERNFPLKIFSRKFKNILISYVSPFIQKYKIQIENELNLKDRITKIWSDFYQGFELNHKLFLVFAPTKLKIFPIEFVKNNLILNGIFETGMSFLSNDIYENRRKYNPKLLLNQIILEPELSQESLPIGFFHCDLQLSFKKIEELMNVYMGSGKIYKFANTTVSVGKIQLLPETKNRIRVNLEILSSNYFGKGNISFTGYPKYNSTKKVIYFGDFNLETQFGFFSNFAFTIFQFFSSNIENVVIYDISWLYKYDFNQEMSRIEDILAMSLQLQEHEDFDPIQFEIKQDKIVIKIMLSGKFIMNLEKVPKKFSLM